MVTRSCNYKMLWRNNGSLCKAWGVLNAIVYPRNTEEVNTISYTSILNLTYTNSY